MFLSPLSFSKGFKGRALKMRDNSIMNERGPPRVKDQHTIVYIEKSGRRIGQKEGYFLA